MLTVQNCNAFNDPGRMSEYPTPLFEYLSLERRGNVFIITLRRGQENRLDTSICNDVIRAFHHIQKTLGPGSEGAVITRGHNAKFWCTGVDQDERDVNPFANSDGFFPMIHTILVCQKKISRLISSTKNQAGLPFSNCCTLNRAYLRRCLSFRFEP